jgi:hypothetical protein
LAEQRLSGQPKLLRRHFDRRPHAVENPRRRRQRLAYGRDAARVRNDHVGEGAAGIDGNPKSHISAISR